MLETYGKYIIWYMIIGFVHFLIRYGVNVRKIVKYNQPPYNLSFSIKWSNLIFMQWLFWPIGIILRIVGKISTIGV